MYFISVDCGGSKTAFVLTDELGNKITSCKLGPGNFIVTGVEAATDLICEGVNKLCTDADINKQDIKLVLIACAGYSSERGNAQYDEVAKRKYDFNYFVTSDIDNAMKGSLLDKEGIHLISGTGSIGKASDGVKVMPSVGGWGYYCGSDEGSGYWIGAKLLWHFERQADGREEKTALYDYVMNKFELNNPREIVSVIVDKLENKRDKIATLTMDVIELCKQNDEAAKGIMFEAGVELAKLAKALYKKNEFNNPVNISYSGSIFKAIEYLTPGIEEELKNIPHVFRAPILSPLAGGVLLAMKQVGMDYNEDIINNLKSISEQGE